jgi:hypothetical protein
MTDEQQPVDDAASGIAAHQKHRVCHWCIECREQWPCLVRLLAAENAALSSALEYIAHFDDDALRGALTLHWDMRGRARRALRPSGGGEGEA